MKYLSNFINITILYIIINFIIQINAIEEDRTINILINRPGINDEQYLNRYNTLINEYIKQNKSFPFLSQYNLKFSYCTPKSNEKPPIVQLYENINAPSPYLIDYDYSLYLKCIIDELNNSTYDMILLDDQLLFSDVSYIENHIIQETYGFHYFENFLLNYNGIDEDDIDDIINNNNNNNNSNNGNNNNAIIDDKIDGIQHHNKDILKNAHHPETNLLYGLPYEIDFDVLYYYKDNAADGFNNSDLSEKNSINNNDDDNDNDNVNINNINRNSDANNINKNTNKSNNNDIHINKNNNNNNIVNTTNNNNNINKGNSFNNSSNNIDENEDNAVSRATMKKLFKKQVTKSSSSESNPNSNPNSISNSNSNSNSNSETDSTSNFSNSNINPNSDSDNNSDYNFNFNITDVSIGLEDNNVLINYFVEFIGDEYGVSSNDKPESFYKLYKTDPEIFYNSFRNDVISETGLNINNTLETTVEEAYQLFINKEKKFFRGKASYYKSLKDSTNHGPIALHPLSQNYYSVLTERYLALNKKSKLVKKILIEAAKELTSKEMQLFRAKEFGNIPTFDLNDTNYQQTNVNVNVNVSVSVNDSYCYLHSDICTIYKKLKPIDIKNFFKKDEYNANYMEIRLMLPLALQKSLRENNHTLIIDTFSNIFEIKESTFYLNNPVLIFSNLFVFLIVVVLILVMIKVYKNRKHPILVPISPTLTNLVIIGIILNISLPCFNALINDILLCRIYLVIKFLIGNIILLPILAMTFRVFYIYTNTNKTKVDGRKLNDKRLLLGISIVSIGIIITATFLSFRDKYYLKTTGTLLIDRIYWCYFDEVNYYSVFTNIYYILIYVCIFSLILMAGNISDKFNEKNFIYFIVVYFISSIASELSYRFLNKGNFFGFTVSFVSYMIGSLCSVHILVGSKLIYIWKHPNSDEADQLYKNTVNILDFMPPLPSDDFTNNSKNSNSSKNNEDPFSSNPNYYFFNKKLEEISHNNSTSSSSYHNK